MRKRILFLVLIGSLFTKITNTLNDSPVTSQHQQHRITIFIHGTYGSLLSLFGLTAGPQEHLMVAFTHYIYCSLLGVAKVAHGKTDYALYTLAQKAVGSMNSFYKDRLMEGLGLHKFDLDAIHNCYTASIQSKIKAYDVMARNLFCHDSSDNKTVNIYYSFGWSGALSQQARIQAAHDLYADLSKELELFKQQNIKPSIRFICHSHGGNVVLNLAQIEELDHAHFCIDELIMYATPIQVETEPFCFLPLFKKVFNFYSENDLAQTLDWFSTRTGNSSQRITIPTHHVEHPKNKVMQAKIMMQRNVGTTQQPYEKNLIERMGVLLYGGQPACPHYYDPTHAEFWRPNDWEKNPLLFHPLPMVIYTPVFLMIFDHLNMHDIDINFYADKEALYAQFHVYEHDKHDKKPERIYRMSGTVLTMLKKVLMDGLPRSVVYPLSITLGL